MIYLCISGAMTPKGRVIFNVTEHKTKYRASRQRRADLDTGEFAFSTAVRLGPQILRAPERPPEHPGQLFFDPFEAPTEDPGQRSPADVGSADQRSS